MSIPLENWKDVKEKMLSPIFIQGKAQHNLSLLSQVKMKIFRTSGSSSQHLLGHYVVFAFVFCMLSQKKIKIFQTSGSSSQYLPGHCICPGHRKTFCFVLLEMFPTSIPSFVWKVNNVSLQGHCICVCICILYAQSNEDKNLPDNWIIISIFAWSLYLSRAQKNFLFCSFGNFSDINSIFCLEGKHCIL